MNKTGKIITTVIFSIFLLSGIVLCSTYVQEIVLKIFENLIGRQLNNTNYWISFVFRFGIILIFFSFLAMWLLLRENDRYQEIYRNNKRKIDLYVSIFISLIAFFVFMMPFIIYGENSVITIHDNLDAGVAFFHYIHQHKLFWAFDEQVPLFGGTSTLFLNREGFYLYNFIYCLLPTYVGYVVNHIVSVILGFFCMFYLQKVLFKHCNIIILTITSLAYALLPTITIYKMAVATLPVVPVLFYKLLITKEKRWVVLSFVYPFLSEFSSVGLFVCGFWLIALIILCIKQKKINKRLLFGFLLICVGFLICISRLIYMRFVQHEPLNRDFFITTPVSFIRSFLMYFFSGFWHSATLQNRLVDWIILVGVILVLIKYLKYKQKEINKLTAILLISISIGLFCSIIAALSDAAVISRCIEIIFPPLAGVSFTRIYTFSRVACYVAFSATLLLISENKKYLGFTYLIAILQLLVVFIGYPLNFMDPLYADSEPTWRKNLIGSDDISWKEFYSEKQFSQIKDFINYNGEPVCAVGYQPSVLLYNDFNTIDVYLSVYPYRQQQLWHNLMLPEFNRNPDEMEYFDSWGGLRYVYNKDLGYAPTREKYHEPVNLYIDMNILKNNYQCKYVLSRAEFSNATELGLKYRGTFDLPESIYVIWVYEVE